MTSRWRFFCEISLIKQHFNITHVVDSYGFVEFKFVGQACNAKKQMHEQIVNGRKISVLYVSEENRVSRNILKSGMNNAMQPDYSNEPSDVLMVRNLEYSVTEQDLLECFKTAVGAQVAVDQNRKSRG